MERTELVGLDREIDRALRQLPQPRAPRTLAPRVMQAIAAAAWATVKPVGWRSWPRAWQMFGLVAACWVAAAIVVAVPMGWDWVANAATARGAAALWDMFVAPMVKPAIAVVAVMSMATALLVAGLKHVAWEGQWTTNS